MDLNVHKGNVPVRVQLNRDQVKNAGRCFDQVVQLVEARKPFVPPGLSQQCASKTSTQSYRSRVQPDHRPCLHLGKCQCAALPKKVFSAEMTRPIRFEDYRRYDGGNDRQFHGRLDFAFEF